MHCTMKEPLPATYTPNFLLYESRVPDRFYLTLPFEYIFCVGKVRYIRNWQTNKRSTRMGGNGITTDALFVRIVGAHPNKNIERWKRIPDTDENRSKPTVIEYKGDVLEAFMKESADITESNDFIRFKRLPIDSSMGGLQDVPSLQRWIESEKGANRLLPEKGLYGVKNPVARDGPLILEDEAQIIMGDDTYSLTPPAIRAYDAQIYILFNQRDEQVALRKLKDLIIRERIFDRTANRDIYVRPGAHGASKRYGNLVFSEQRILMRLGKDNQRRYVSIWELICWKHWLDVLRMFLIYYTKTEDNSDFLELRVVRGVIHGACLFNFVKFFDFVGKESMVAWLKKNKKLSLYVPLKKNASNSNSSCIFHPNGDRKKIILGGETVSTSRGVNYNIALLLLSSMIYDAAEVFYWIIANCDINPYDTRLWTDHRHIFGPGKSEEQYRHVSNFENAVNHYRAKKIRLTANLSIIPKPSLTAVYFNSSSEPFVLKRMSLKESRAPVTLTLRELYKVVEAEDNTSPELVRFIFKKSDTWHVLPQWEDFAIEADVHLLSLGVTPGDTIMVRLRLGPPLSPKAYDWIYELSDQYKRK